MFAVFSNISDELTNNGYPGIIKPLVVVVVATIVARYIYFEKAPTVRSKTVRIEAFLFLYFLVLGFDSAAVLYLICTPASASTG